ncbi:hypothetical protein J3L18_05265 [Mucilaginibacter gossypii]|uniref:hypothetical protein n=1 Tax=Mucilaginibacter gossypii TaxID=551996 RepID=UPI000DCE192A|nr:MULTISPECIES: hypothetical protein [Mucilaginibacter]QTE38487.1 hypothetical protein J3L18_05265 [Mucilaginibacter gossypii]RAV59671.1 hypothetical protein DIU36_04325 [Mucilaginibacter rubeus]
MIRIQQLSSCLFFVNKRDAVLTIERHTTTFNNQDELLGVLSMPGEHPLEPNRAIIQNSHYILTPNGRRSFEVLVWFDDEPYKRATYVYTIENGVIKYTLFFDAGTIATFLKNTSLTSAFKFTGNLYAFESYAALQAFMTETTTGTAATYPLVFFPFKNDGAYKEVTGDAEAGYPDIHFPVSTIINRWEMNETGDGSFVVDDGLTPKSQTQIPFFYLVYVLKRVWEGLGYKVIGKWCNQETSQRITIGSTIAIQNNIIADYWFYMPDITLADLFKEVRSSLGVFMDPDATNKTVLIESITNLKRTAKTVDLRGAQLINYRETGTIPAGYVISRPIDDKDEAFDDSEKANLPKLTVGVTSLANPELQDIPLKSVITKMIKEAAPSHPDIETPVSAQWRIPYMKQPVTAGAPLNQLASQDYADRNAFKLRLLYYHGMKANEGGYLYPYGSADNIGLTGNIISDYTLGLDGSADSLLEVRNYFTFMYNSRPFEMTFLLSRRQLFNIGADCRILVKDFNGPVVNCFLDQFTADLSDKPENFAAITLYPLITPNNTRQIDGLSPVEPEEPPFDNGTVYARLGGTNFQTVDHTVPPPAYLYFTQDVGVAFFSDSAGTIPKDVTRLNIRIRQRRVSREPDGIVTDTIFPFEVSGTYVVPLTSVLESTNQPGSSADWAYALLDSADYHIIF